MKIELYPKFEEVFEDNTLKGIFYPLCKVFDLGGELPESLFLVSNNGVWMNETEATEFNSSHFTAFELLNGKYKFKGNLALYQGYEIFRKVFQILEIDFKVNGHIFLESKKSTEEYIDYIKPILTFDFEGLDIDYYLRSFYAFSIDKLYYQKTGIFGGFYKTKGNNTFEGFGVYGINNESGYGEIVINQRYFLPEWINLENFKEIAYVVGIEFFEEGNDSYLVYDPDSQKVISLNYHS